MSSINDSDVELRRFTSINSQQTVNSNGGTSYHGEQKGGNNPSYLSFDSDRGGGRGPEIIMDPTSSDRMYDVVPGEKHGAPPPPLPEARRTTPNAMYASRGETLHPNATLEKNMTAAFSQEGIEADIDHMSSKCLRVTCLSILVVASLFLAIVAVVLVLLLWFGVYVPQPTAASSCSVQPTSTAQGLTGGPLATSLSSTPLPSPISSSTCLCPTPDLSPIISRIENETANLTGLINNLDEEITLYKMQSNTTDQTLLSQSNAISSQVSDINSTCHETLVNLTSQNVSLSGLEFDAELRNVGLYSNCIYEYLSNCTIGQNDTNCTTADHTVLVDGYFNLDVACHVDITHIPLQPSGVFFAPLTNLRTEAQPGQSINYGSDSGQQILSKSQMKCECSLVALIDGHARSNIVTCYLFRSRCPVMNTFQNVVVVTPP